MAKISDAELKKEINAILKKADLSTTTAKKVRQQLEDSLGVDLSGRRKEIDKMVMNYVNSQDEAPEEKDGEEEEEEDNEEDGADESEEEKKPKKSVKRAAPPKKTSAKKAKKGSDEESASEESVGEDEYKPNKKTAAKKKSNKKKGADSDSDLDWGKNKKKKGGGGKGKGTGYTREYKLSPELAELMGKESMPRHEVVKRVWALIKERNLYDQSNKQFAICDDDLYKVIGTKRFRTFGMMKYLKTHFHD